jgi:hypothetical protein
MVGDFWEDVVKGKIVIKKEVSRDGIKSSSHNEILWCIINTKGGFRVCGFG